MDKQRIFRENRLAEALLGPGKTGRNLMRAMLTGFENGKGVGVTVGADGWFTAPLQVSADLTPPQPDEIERERGGTE